MIELDDVSFRYSENGPLVLDRIDLTIPDGELALVAGPTGSGKSSLLGLLNGLVPHFSGGILRGTVTVDGLRTADRPPRQFAGTVGFVSQDPLAGFVTDTVEEELAYGMEQLGTPASTMRTRVEETLDLLGIADLRNRALRTLSGGQQQRVAIGSVLAAGPRILVLDEPTSALDPTSAEEVVAAVVRLVHDLGITVVMAEHRLERVLQYADRLLLLDGAGRIRDGDPAELIADSPIAPPLIELARVAGWSPVPLSIRDARRLAPALRDRLAAALPDRSAPALRDRSVSSVRPPPVSRDSSAPVLPDRSSPESRDRPPAVRTPSVTVGAPRMLQARGVSVRYGALEAVRGVDLTVGRGEIVALMGRNGSGKSSLLWAVSGFGRRSAGTVALKGVPLAKDYRDGSVALVPQTASDLLYLNTVDAECDAADRQTGGPAGACRALLDRLAPGVDGSAHPRDLSEGQRLALVLAIQLTAEPQLVLLDEPTRGLDYRTKSTLINALQRLAADGTALVVASHDVEFVAQLAHRVLVMAVGEIVADGRTVDVLAGSPAFAPQVAKVLYPQPWLTVDQVRSALGAADD